MIEKEFDSLYNEKAQKKPVLPKELISETPLDSSSPSQNFFRVSQRASKSKQTMIKLGWKVAELSREQVDLALYCLAVLQAELSPPFGFFGSNRKAPQGEIKDIWIEWHVLLSGASKDDHLNKSMMEVSIFNFCHREVLPRLRDFITEELNWEHMCSQEFQDSRVLEVFERKVKTPLGELLKAFRVGKSYLE